MIHCKNTPNALYFSSVEEISSAIWQQLGCTDDIYFNPTYLSAIANNHSQMTFSYIILTDEKQHPIAFATIQIVDFYLDSVQNDMQSLVETAKCVGRKLGIINPQKPFRILTCGNTFVSGEHGVFIKNNQNKKNVIKELAKAIVHFVDSNKELKNSISAFMLKDFIQESLVITDELHEYNYYSFNVDPNMLMHVDEDWYSFDAYLASMKTKFRVKAKKALTMSAELKIRTVTSDTIVAYIPRMTSLYTAVSSKASFNLEKFNLETYQDLKNLLGEDYIIQTYWLNNTMVGFLSAIINQDTLDAHFVGIDYKYNRQYAVYQRILYDYIQIAIDRKITTINFGRTASEIKSSVGAVPQDLTIYLRHKKSISNKILSLFLNKIKPSEFRQNYPFKAKNLVTEL